MRLTGARGPAGSLSGAAATAGCRAPRIFQWSNHLGSGWETPMSEAAWKAERERIAARNDEARKAGKKERETADREREERRRVVEARRQQAARKNSRG